MVEEFDLSHEIAKAAITFVFAAVLGGAAGALWARARHRRKLSLEAGARFYDAYGTWFATWKAWEAFLEGKTSGAGRDALLTQATNVEGQFEALLIRIATERRLSAVEISRLGRFREGYQRLRESIESGDKLPFRVQYDSDKVSAYVAFKSLSTEFAALLEGRHASNGGRLSAPLKSWRRPGLHESQRAFVEVTSWRSGGNDGKDGWWRSAGNDSSKKALETWESLEHCGGSM